MSFTKVESKKKNRNRKTKNEAQDEIYQFIKDQKRPVTPEEIQEGLNYNDIRDVWDLLDTKYLLDKLDRSDFKYTIKK